MKNLVLNALEYMQQTQKQITVHFSLQTVYIKIIWPSCNTILPCFIIYFQVQETARSIIENLEGDSEQTLPVTSSPAGGRPSVDKAADKWSLAFCEFYRDN